MQAEAAARLLLWERGQYVKLIRLVAILAVLGIVAAGCGGNDDDAGTDESGTQQEEPSGTLKLGTQSTRTGYPSPWGSASFTDNSLSYLVYEQLVYLDENGQPQPRLAESWETSEDGVILTMKLREDVTFHDGAPFNAEAVKANLEFVKTGPAKVVVPTIAQQLGNIESVEVLGEFEIALHQVNPGELETLLWLGRQSGYMVSPADFETAPVGTGPYKINTTKSASDFTTLVLDANMDYWKERAVGLEKIEITRMPDNAARAAAFNAGQLDIVIGYSSMGEPSGGTADYSGHSLQSFQIVDWQGKQIPALANKEVRCAIAEAFNKPGVAKTLGQSADSAADQWGLKDGDYIHIPDLDVPSFDVEAAKERFEATGEEPFTMKTGMAVSDHVTTAAMGAWAGALQEIGITVEQETYENPAETYVALSQNRYPILSIPFADPHPLIPLLQRAHPDGVFNPTKAAPVGVEELIKSARTKTHEEAEADIAAAWKIMLEECIWIPHMFLDVGYWVSDKITGFEGLPLALSWEPRGVRIED